MLPGVCPISPQTLQAQEPQSAAIVSPQGHHTAVRTHSSVDPTDAGVLEGFAKRAPGCFYRLFVAQFFVCLIKNICLISLIYLSSRRDLSLKDKNSMF